MKVVNAMILAGMILTGCGQAQDESTASSTHLMPRFSSSEFLLLDKPNVELTGCDVASKLVFTRTRNGLEATVTDLVLGFCDLYVPANPRSYTLRTEDAGCGSKRLVEIYGSDLQPSRIEIIDHRARLCDDLQPARLVVKELVGDEYVKKYSYDRHRS